MFCSMCGTQLPEHADFCTNCGAPVSAQGRAPSGAPAYGPTFTVTPPDPAGDGGGSPGRQLSEHLFLGDDGVYRWTYEYSLFKRPGIFFLIWKIFFFITLGIFLFMMILTAAEGDMDGERALDMLKYFGIGLLGMTALVGISYLIYAAINGGKYIVVFEMDENGVIHRQIDRQARKMEKVADAAFFLGALTGNRGAMAAGLNQSTEMYTAFASVGRLRAYPRKHLIKLREALSHNQVFAYPEDYDFVLRYMLDRVPDKAKKNK